MSNLMERFRHMFGGKPEHGGHEITVHAYPKLVHVWPVIFVGFLFWSLQGTNILSLKAEAWIYLTVTATVLLTLGIDLGRNASIFWIILMGMFLFIALWLRDAKGFTIFDSALRYFAVKQPEYSVDMGFILSLGLSIVYVVMIVNSWMNDRWRFTHNEIEHYSFGRSDKAMARGSKQVSSSYPDLLELLITMTGTITIYDARGREKLGEIEGVPFLPFKMKRLSKILEATAVTPTTGDDDEALDDGHHDEDSNDPAAV